MTGRPPPLTLSADDGMLLTFRPALIPVEFVSTLIFGGGRFVATVAAAWIFNASDDLDGVVIVIDSLPIGVDGDGVDDDSTTNVVAVVSFNVICLVCSRCVTVSFTNPRPTFGRIGVVVTFSLL